MTNEELAKHWGISVKKVKNISDFMNKSYYLCVGRKKTDGLFYGLIYRIDEKHGPMLAVSSSKGFKTPKEAGNFINGACDTIQLPEVKAKIMNVPVDAYKTLTRIDTAKYQTPTQSRVISGGRDARD